ncbi:hypothetical protein K502DRAFT_345477 [Neoconidiobolus thromboides FSU 785]|nr:hypothetical protein K502DRAFT_345477 [Neoconidiobolus thromboides FSU 785]
MKDFFGTVENSLDILLLLEGVNRGYFRVIEGKLTETEKREIKVGTCFICEYKGSDLEELEDGKKWMKYQSKNKLNYFKQLINDVNSKNKLIKKEIKLYYFNRRLQILNYVSNSSSVNKSLIRPSYSHLMNFLHTKSTNSNLGSISTSLNIKNFISLPPISQVKTNLSSILPPIKSKISDHILLYYSKNFNLIETLEFKSNTNLCISEDLRQLSLFQVRI